MGAVHPEPQSAYALCPAPFAQWKAYRVLFFLAVPCSTWSLIQILFLQTTTMFPFYSRWRAVSR